MSVRFCRRELCRGAFVVRIFLLCHTVIDCDFNYVRVESPGTVHIILRQLIQDDDRPSVLVKLNNCDYVKSARP